MWARNFEVLLGLWLATAPFLFGHASVTGRLWLHDLTIGTLIAVVSILTYVPALRRLHLLHLATAAWLFGYGWWRAWTTPGTAEAVTQNWIVVALTLAIFAIVPTSASTPPVPWRRAPSARG